MFQIFVVIVEMKGFVLYIGVFALCYPCLEA